MRFRWILVTRCWVQWKLIKRIWVVVIKINIQTKNVKSGRGVVGKTAVFGAKDRHTNSISVSVVKSNLTRIYQ